MSRFFLLLLVAMIFNFFLITACAQTTPSFPLQDVFAPLPANLPLVSRLLIPDWEKIPDWSFTYDGYYAFYLYVEPGYDFYQIIHYRWIPEKTRRSGVKEWDFSSAEEGLSWIDRRNLITHYFKLHRKLSWKKLWFGRTKGEWKTVDSKNPAFQQVDATVKRLLRIHLENVHKREQRKN